VESAAYHPLTPAQVVAPPRLVLRRRGGRLRVRVRGRVRVRVTFRVRVRVRARARVRVSVRD
jgi:hypothetical protein